MNKNSVNIEEYLDALNVGTFDADAFVNMQVLLRAEIDDLNLRLEKLTESIDFNAQLFKDMHFTLVTKMKILYLIEQFGEEYRNI